MQSDLHAGQTRPATGLQVERLEGLAALPESEWAALNPGRSPFLDYHFLAGLEARGLTGAGTDWRPSHLVARRGGTLHAGLPLYEKSDSFGEFVFDWAWADAYRRTGRRYYPKLVCAVPFTPVPGCRVLAASVEEAAAAVPALLTSARRLARERRCSSLHILFANAEQARLLHEEGLEVRADCRFVWKNQGFGDFDDFLSTFSSRQRKNIRRERRKVQEAGIELDWITGDELARLDWATIHALCARTFQLRGHTPYLDAGFFEGLAQRMPERLLINLARRNGSVVAAAIFFRDSDTLYGRYWGADEQVDCLHFESCYYQGIEYAIRQGLARFDPGTQGEHKLRRGFMPVPSWSLHWFANAQAGRAIASWLAEERRLVRECIEYFRAKMPFSAAPPTAEEWP